MNPNNLTRLFYSVSHPRLAEGHYLDLISAMKLDESAKHEGHLHLMCETNLVGDQFSEPLLNNMSADLETMKKRVKYLADYIYDNMDHGAITLTSMLYGMNQSTATRTKKWIDKAPDGPKMSVIIANIAFHCRFAPQSSFRYMLSLEVIARLSDELIIEVSKTINSLEEALILRKSLGDDRYLNLCSNTSMVQMLAHDLGM